MCPMLRHSFSSSLTRPVSIVPQHEVVEGPTRRRLRLSYELFPHDTSDLVGTDSRVKLLDDPEKIARKRFMAFLSSLRSIVKHTKSRHHSDHQKVFKLDFKKRWPPIKKR